MDPAAAYAVTMGSPLLPIPLITRLSPLRLAGVIPRYAIGYVDARQLARLYPDDANMRVLGGWADWYEWAEELP